MQDFLLSFYSLNCPQASSLMASMNLVVLFESPELFCKRGASGATAVPELHNVLGGGAFGPVSHGQSTVCVTDKPTQV